MKQVAIIWVLTACTVGEEAPDQPSADETYRIAGRTVDYFTGKPVGGIGFETLGLATELTGTSGGDGAYSLEVPVGSAFFVRTVATDNTRPTISEVPPSETADLAVFSRADIARQHATTGVAVEPDTATVYVELATFDGQPISAFDRSTLSIIDPATSRAIGSTPFVVGATGDIDPAATTATGAVARFAFLNVPSGEYALAVACSTCTPAIDVETTLIASAGVTLSRVTVGGGQAPAATSFANVYPLLQHGASGGLGCANCHTAGGASSPAFDGPPDDVLASLRSLSLVDVADPDRSQLLRRPLFETPADHPNATFLSASDPDYQLIRAWIAGGAN